MTFFSVVITNYNHEKFIMKSIKSVLNQSFKNFELIIIDNYSSDNSKKIIRSFKDKRIKFFQIKNKGIIAKSRNYGIKKAKSDWIAFLDSDDYWFKNKLEIFFNTIKRNNNFQVFSNNETMRFESKEKYKNLISVKNYNPKENEFYKDLIILGNKLSLSATVVNRKFLTKNKIFFREKKKFVTAEDYDFLLNLSLNGAKFYFLNKILGVYFIHNSNLSSKRKLHFDNTLSVCRSHILKKNRIFENKYNILKFVEFRLKLNFLKNEFKNKYSFLVLMNLIFVLINNPLILTRFLLKKMVKIKN